MDITTRCQTIELILSDVDGVLTDGLLTFDSRGVEAKQFHVHDGQGISLWRKAGYKFGLISLRSSPAVKMRADELGLEIVRQGAGNKLDILHQILDDVEMTPDQICYLGDDLPDLPVIRNVGLGVAVADACKELQEAAHYVTRANGGRGAVRETIEMILKAQNRWNEAIRTYSGSANE